jgi:hypothetical protein
MSRVTRVEQRFDQELAEKVLRRTCAREWIHDGKHWGYVSREVIVPIVDSDDNRIPWWKREKKKTQRQ